MRRERFAIIPLSVLTDSRLSGRDLRTYAAIATFADKNGTCWPSLAKLCECSGVRARDIPIHTARLEGFGLIARTRRGKKLTNSYQLRSDSPDSKESLREGDSPEIGVGDSPEMRDSSIQTNEHTNMKNRKRAKNNPPSQVSTFRIFWKAEYQKHYTREYIWRYGKEDAITKGLLESLSLEELQLRAERFLRNPGKWVKDNGGPSLSLFPSQMNRLDISGAVTAATDENEFLTLMNGERKIESI